MSQFLYENISNFVCLYSIFQTPSPSKKGILAEKEPVKTLQLEKTRQEIGRTRPEVQDGQLLEHGQGKAGDGARRQ